MIKLFQNKPQFPKETDPGNTYIKDDFLYFDDHGNEEIIELSKLKYAYIEILGDRPFLFLFDYHQHYISCQLKGFSTIYSQLSKRFGFDDQMFFKTIKSKKEQKQRIWIRKQSKNYEIAAGKIQNYTDGFEVLSDPPQFISWDTSYLDYEQMNVGHAYLSDFESSIFKFNYPVRIGSLIINELEFYNDNDRKEIAVQFYFATLYNEENTDGSYQDLRDLWLKEIPTDIDDAGYERVDQKYLTFNLDDISLSICYTYDAEDGYDDGCTSIGIRNYRDYSHIILKQRDDLHEENTKTMTFTTPFEFIPDYQNNARVTAKPTLINKIAGHQQAMYLNTDTNKFGFTGDQYAIEYGLDQVEKIIIQNVLPAKGGGYAELFVKTKKLDYADTIYFGELYEMDQYSEQISQILGLEVEMPEPYYNC